MSQPAQLLKLQQVDTQLDNARSRLAEIETALSDNAAVRQAQKKAQAAKDTFIKAQLALKHAEQDVETQQKKIENNQKILYGGSVKNPKELEDLQHESEALSRYLDVLEEKQLEAMITFEEAEAAHQGADANLEKVNQHTADQNVELTKEQADLLKEVDNLEDQRQKEVSGIDAGDLATYTKLRETRGGLAVTTVEKNTCSACGGTLTASQAQAARSPNKITTCESCKRILYAL